MQIKDKDKDKNKHQNQNPWLNIIDKLNLSRAEQAVVRRFGQDPTGRGFLPVADILRTHRKIEESIELLAQGVDQHPQFTVARVVLARELFGRGMVLQAWTTLDSSPHSLDDNVLAQKLRLKIAILLGLQNVSLEVARTMSIHQMHDEETQALADMLRVSTIETVRDRLVTELRRQGTQVILPSKEELDGLIPVGNSEKPPAQAQDSESDIDHDDSDPRESEQQNKKADGFHVLPLNEVFRGRDAELGGEPIGTGGVELDSTTLADLYVRQGHFNKAIAIYRRLLRLTPHSDFLKRKIREATRLESKQKNEDFSLDPQMADQMEALEIVNTQIKFFDQLLEKLERKS